MLGDNLYKDIYNDLEIYKMTLLSLIIPCYNEENTLEACVNCCMQLHKHPLVNLTLELIIVCILR